MVRLPLHSHFIATAALALCLGPLSTAGEGSVVCGLDVQTEDDDTKSFEIAFQYPPDFFTTNGLGRPADEFQVFIDREAASAPGDGNWEIIVRGGEIYLASQIRLRNAGPPESASDAGGWGAVRGAIDYEIDPGDPSGPVVRFSLHAFNDLGDPDGEYSYRLETYRYGSWEDCLEFIGVDENGIDVVRRCYPDAKDCNANGLADQCESAGNDCTGNGILDECEPDCNANGTADSCDLANGTSEDLSLNGIPDECEPDVHVLPVVSRTDPSLKASTADSPPPSTSVLPIGSPYWIEVWATDVGVVRTGFEAIYVGVAFSAGARATGLVHDPAYSEDPDGFIGLNAIEEFGGTAASQALGVSPQWVRVGWIRMRADVITPVHRVELFPSGVVSGPGRGEIPWELAALGFSEFAVFDPVAIDADADLDVDLDDFTVYLDCAASPGVPPAPTLPPSPGSCLAAFEVDNDGDVDFRDYARFQFAFDRPAEGGYGDWGGDGVVEFDDFIRFADCFAGPDDSPAPELPSPSVCLAALDVDSDADVDFRDYAEFQNGFGILLLPGDGDWDLDGDVDLDDYQQLPLCVYGPNESSVGGCELFDFDADADVDFADLALFQEIFGG